MKMQKILTALIIAALFIDASPTKGGDVKVSLGLGFAEERHPGNPRLEWHPVFVTQRAEVGYALSDLWEVGALGTWRHTANDFDRLGNGCPPDDDSICPLWEALVETEVRVVRKWYSASIFGRYYLAKGKSRAFVTASGGIARRIRRSSIKVKFTELSWVEHESDGGFEARVGIGYDRTLSRIFFLRGDFTYAVILPRVFRQQRSSLGLGFGIRI